HSRKSTLANDMSIESGIFSLPVGTKDVADAGRTAVGWQRGSWPQRRRAPGVGRGCGAWGPLLAASGGGVGFCPGLALLEDGGGGQWAPDAMGGGEPASVALSGAGCGGGA